jgi:DNA-binding FadR family transcriptional regulator
MRRTDEDLMRMKKVLQLEEEYMDNWERFHQTDVDFHETVANAARNRVASILMKVIRQMLVETITAGFKRLSLEQRKYEQARLLEHHWQIASAIERQDPEEAVKILHEHLLQFKNLFPINGKNDEEQ